MSKLLISSALAGLLFSAGAAMAQPHDNRGPGGEPMDRGAARPPAAHAAPAPHPAAAPGGNRGNAPNDHRDRTDNRPSAGQQHAPEAQPAPRNAMRGPIPGSPAHGPAMAGPSRGPGAGRGNNFTSFQRNFNSPRRFRAQAYSRPSGWYPHHWTFGETLPSLFWSRNYWLNDYVNFGLAPPPPGTVWVRDGSDALLIDQTDGEIIQVAYGVFY